MAILTATVAALVAIITYGQWVTNRARLRHELFDRRFRIFEHIAGFLAAQLQSDDADYATTTKLLRQTKQAYFAFGCDGGIKQLVDNIHNQANLLHALKEKVKILSGDPLNRNLDKQLEVRQWFEATFKSLDQKFEKYLRLVD